ncbi:hypothetical protein KIPE111705_31400 [Kibdelosporangium persicum]|uniref:Uncharacterized protein n=1 Tax=Kibdelosporangium persicum TaxID=2698649 RepID=A0ABX2EV02_9PSEU|nr:hypothetical protein [Kibdelosporangium persicum]NRN62861.1 hypothetical protein [Kibdelosporangium persicum]
MNIVTELTNLSLHRPAPDATDAEVATWYERKATVHDAMAADADGVVAAKERAYAAAARAHARSLSQAAA